MRSRYNFSQIEEQVIAKNVLQERRQGAIF